MRKLHRILFLLLLLSAIISCKKTTTDIDSYVPIVFVHGYYGSGDSYTKMIAYFRANGYPADKLFTYDWNTVVAEAPKNTKPLDDFIQEVKRKTGYDKINLVGHSLGGSLTYNYCSDVDYANNINRLAWLAPYLLDRTKLPSSSIATLNLRSDADYVVRDTNTIPDAVNIVIPGVDHNEIASCEASFTEIFKFFNDGKTPILTIPEDNDITISGKVVSLLENYVSSGYKIEIYEVSESTGARLSTTPAAVLYTAVKGYYGDFHAKKNTYYEFQVSTGLGGDKPIHFYFEPFKNSSNAIYLRTFPPQTSFLNVGLNAIVPVTDSQGVSIFYSVSKAVILGKDALTINGYDCVNATYTDKELNTSAIFLFDNNKNAVSDYTPVSVFSAVQEFKGIDFSLPANEFSTYVYNGRTLHTYNWPSASKGISVAMFY